MENGHSLWDSVEKGKEIVFVAVRFPMFLPPLPCRPRGPQFCRSCPGAEGGGGRMWPINQLNPPNFFIISINF